MWNGVVPTITPSISTVAPAGELVMVRVLARVCGAQSSGNTSSASNAHRQLRLDGRIGALRGIRATPCTDRRFLSIVVPTYASLCSGAGRFFDPPTLLW